MKYQLWWCSLFYLLFSPFTMGQSGPSELNLDPRKPYRFPDDDEYTICSRIRDVIPRDSGRFRKILIRNTNDQADYANDDCRRMTSRAKSKLDILASLVHTKWAGRVKVKVLLAWTDQIDPADRVSLHYEGRSLRLQLSDGDRSKLGSLGGLAIEAGFEWVHYASRDYIRASVIPDVCQTSVDLVFLLDGSGSVGKSNFEKVRVFVKKVVDFFNIGETGTHVAVVTYESSTHLEFKLDKFVTKSDLRKAIDRVDYNGLLTYTGEALEFVKKYVFTESAGMRADIGIPKVLVLLTDGHSNGREVFNPANELRNAGVSIFSIGVGSSVSEKELKDIASDPDDDYVFRLSTFNELSKWVDRLSSVSCSEGSLIQSCKSAVTTVTSGSFKYFRTEFNDATNNDVSVEVQDVEGVSHLYASSTSRNPGPLDPDSILNEDSRSPRAVSITLGNTKTVYVAVQGQTERAKFSLSFWNNLFSKSVVTETIMENLSAGEEFDLKLASHQYTLEYSITHGNDDGYFQIETNVPTISTTKALDREAVGEYNLVVVAQDKDNQCHKSRTQVVIKVGDANDNSPKFTENPYQADIKENAQPGAVVETVQATDEDYGANAQITYSIISGNPGNLFSIDSDGRVTLKGALDYEDTKSYSLGIRAEDGGSPGRSADTVLDVSVIDVNEGPSISCQGGCSLKVSEDVGSGADVGRVIGTDPEASPSCGIRFDIPSDDKDTFQVGSDGKITTSKGLDRELTAQYVFVVRVEDCGLSPLSASVIVTVTVEDVNDNDPKFNGPYSVDILENEAVGSNVVQVKADDPDAGVNGEIRYSLQLGPESLIFEIDAVSGRITTKNMLDYEKQKLYSVTVIATDRGTSPRRATTVVSVNIVDVNDNKPIFSGLPYSETVKEDASKGTLVKSVIASDDDSGLNGEVRFSILYENIGNAFVMDSISGDITVNSKLDHETRSSYTLTIRASDRGSPSQTSQTKMTITIGDVNDNVPVFHGAPYSESVSENTPVNQSILKVSATDEDSGVLGQITYSIVDPVIAQQTFKIDSNGNIHAKLPLDYETIKEYHFKIAATDGGGISSTANVVIFIKDFNDNGPIFELNPYTASVAENVSVGHVVKDVRATDEDSGPRGSVTYSITSGNVGSAFRITTDGSVTVDSLLDRETLDAYTLTIQASDDGTPSRSATTQVDISITDVNDNRPSFEKLSYSFRVTENNPSDHEVGKVGPATDEDKDENGEIVYSIISGDSSGMFYLGSSGELKALKSLDREMMPSYDLIIEARDKGSPSLYSQVPVKVIVDDKNDNAPEFSPKSYDCEISENSAEKTRVCFVHASDKDADQNGAVTYELVGLSSFFSVDQNNGEIKSKVTFDREQTPSYTFMVRANDGGSPIMNSTATVNVKVIDKNDNEPVFTNLTYNFDVSENAKVKTKIGRVVAEDIDDGLNGEVGYSIIGGNTDNAFEIIATTGDIQVKSSLDREKLASYVLNVRANDRGTPSLFSSRLVSIKVKDVNDNSPVFTKSLYSGIIAEDASFGSAVVQVIANDPDEGDNGKITYSITGGENRNNFSIEGDTGFVRTATALDYEKISSYLLDVTASDGGNPSRSSTSRVNITVTNTNDNVPTFVPGSPTVSVSEGVAIRTVVVQFNATDEDGSALKFSITSGNTDDALTIDIQTGLLTTNKVLDRETIPRYNLTVTVTDSGNQSSSRDLSVIVLDINDNAPIFEPSSYRVDVTENTPAGSIVTVTATDRDEGQNANISFSIDSSFNSKFTIDSTTGELSFKTPLDYEDGAQYVIQVTAKDAGKPPLRSVPVATVEVTVIDTNDNSPHFKNDYSTSLREDTAQGKTLLRVEATDPDSGVNGEIEYTISSGNGAGFFSLDTTDGVLKVVTSPDRETNPSFNLTIVASNKVPVTDSAPATNTSCNVFITIEDVNDNAPEITNDVTMVDIQENSKPVGPIFDVEAVDKDVGANGEIQFEIVSGNVRNAFTIDPVTGEVSVNGSLLDRETLDFYTLKIKASDKGTPSLFSKKDFTVNVTDEDDNKPIFEGTPYDASVSEKANVSTSVIQVKATDKDIGVNGKIAYSIHSGNNQGHFTIDTASGEVSTDALLNYEMVQNYDLVIAAKDTQHTAKANLRIRIVNINDNSPVFNPVRYNVSIAENAQLDEQFVTLNATDLDPFDGLTYTIVSGNDDSIFALDSKNGQFLVASQLDRETTDFYNLTVRVTDGGIPAFSDLGFVQVYITDINDNSPKFYSLSEKTSVMENSEVGVVVLKVNATDRDLGVNAKLKYSITKGNDENKFNIDPNTGELRVNGDIDRETTSFFYLDIIATDQGSPSLTSETLRVKIAVDDENDNVPEFDKQMYYQNITENLSAGAFVEQIKATDKDLYLNGEVVYSIKNGANGHFIIGNKTGIIETTVPLDRENIPSYNIVVEARDLGTPKSRKSTVSVFVKVVDANDNAPRFQFVPYLANVTEEQPEGQFVTRISAVDSDEGRNAEVEYKLATQQGDKMLKIDPQSGVITTRVLFDYENEKVYTFKVTASDKGNPSLSTTTDLTVNVTDIDDNCPEFYPKEYNVTIRENLPLNYTIVQVTATDKDSAHNKNLDYGIRSGNEGGSLGIDPVTGVIKPSSDVDREYSAEYNLVVRAGSDSCGVNIGSGVIDETTKVKLSASIAHVNIFVTDVNDSPPKFSKPSYSHIFSDILQTSLLWLNATDEDVGVNAKMDFGLAGVERFGSKRILTVKATDRGKPPQASNTTLTVTMAQQVNCEAMNFDVSPRGHVTVKTLCIFEKVKIVGSALVGKTIKLDCSAKGNTVPEYRWIRNGVPVTDWLKTGTYSITSLSKDDAGQYACIASSEAGNILSTPIKLEVKEPPTITGDPQETWAEVDKKAVLHCVATGDQPMVYTWYKNNKRLSQTDGLVTNKKDLVFEKTIIEDAAKYYCEVTNNVRKEPARSKVARLEIYTKYAIIEMDVEVDKPKIKESCQYFDKNNLTNNLKNIVDMEVVMIEFNKPETICNVTSCSSDPCKNQGKCITTDSGFVCQCPRGWFGDTCHKDVDECKTETCGSGTCQNRPGSFSCDCKAGSSGKRCQLSNSVCQTLNLCLANQTCYPKETLAGYECIDHVETISMVYKLDELRRPWKDWMKYDVAREIQNAISNKRDSVTKQRSQESRKRRNIAGPEYRACSVIIENPTTPIGETEVELKAVLVCVTAPSKTYVCQAMFDEGKVSSCSGNDGPITETPPTQPPTMAPVRLTVAFIVFNPTSKKEMEAALAISKFLRSNVGSTLKKEGVTTIAYRARHPRSNTEARSGTPAAVIIGVIVAVIVVLIVAIAIAFVVIRTRDQEVAHEQFNMADRSPTKKAQLKHAVSMKELNDSEVRGVHNTGFHEIYEECGNIPYDLEDGAFMVRNPQFTKRIDLEYMNEIESSPWYYGIISRYKAEDILNDGNPVGSFLVRGGIKKGEFYISVKAPEGGPPVLHIEVDRYEDEFVAVCGSSPDPVEFPTFNQLIEYLQSAPIHYEGFASDIVLKDFVANHNK